MTTSFQLTFDYLCPFARNANEAVVEGIASGADWSVAYRPFSLSQTKVEEGDLDVWDRPADADGVRGVLALQWGIAVRDTWPETFPAFHVALFAARHEHGVDIGAAAALADIAAGVGLDPVSVATEVDAGWPRRTLADEHRELVTKWDVFGVPTFIAQDEAVFVRTMERHRPDEIGRIVDLLTWTNLNEFKRTRIPR